MQTIGVLTVFVLLFASYNFDDTAGADEEAVLLEEPLSRDSVSVQSTAGADEEAVLLEEPLSRDSVSVQSTAGADEEAVLFEEPLSRDSVLVQSRQGFPDLCDSPSIDAAVRVALNKYIFLFKGEHYWVLNTESELLDDLVKPIAKVFTNDKNVDLRDVEAAWVGQGFDYSQQLSGYINILKSNVVFRFKVEFNSPLTYNIKFNNSLGFDVFWTQSKSLSAIRAITQLNTYKNYEDQSDKPRDLLVLDKDWFQVLWTKDGTDMNYETKYHFFAKSEKGSNRLSLFDPTTRDAKYWNTIPSEPTSDVLDITALVYYPSDSDNKNLFAFGPQEYCKINIKSSTLNVTCKKTSLKNLYGCQRSGSPPIQEVTGTDGSGSGHTLAADPEVGVKDKDNKNSEKSSNPVFYIIGAIVVLIIIIAIFALIACLCVRKRTKRKLGSKRPKSKSITKGPIDPRYGQLDSALNLHLRIANPSTGSLDRQMKRSDSIKSESGSLSSQTNKK